VEVQAAARAVSQVRPCKKIQRPARVHKLINYSQAGRRFVEALGTLAAGNDDVAFVEIEPNDSSNVALRSVIEPEALCA